MTTQGDNKIAILFLGLPGSGKTTHSLLLREEFNLVHLTTSRVIRDKFRSIPIGQDEEIDEERRRYDAGQIVDPQLVSSWLNETIKQVFDANSGIILDGSPRSLMEAKLILPTLKKLYGDNNILAIHLTLSQETSFRRTSTRLVCLDCEKTYSWNPNFDLKNCQDENCRGILTRKLLDDPKIFEKRLEIFKNQTQKAIDFFKAQDMFLEINGEQDIDDVYQEITSCF